MREAVRKEDSLSVVGREALGHPPLGKTGPKSGDGRRWSGSLQALGALEPSFGTAGKWGGILAVMVLAPFTLSAQAMTERCGEVVPEAPPEPPGRWLNWSGDSFAGRETFPEHGPILDRLASFAGPFQEAAVLDPPPR